MKIRFAKKSERGSSLPEVVLATTIVAITATAVISAYNYGFFVMRLARENQRATQIILEKAETIRLYTWNQVTNNPSTGLIPDTFVDVFDPQLTNTTQIGYTGVVEIATPALSGTPDYEANIRQINITLQWVGAGNILRTRTFFTFVAKDGQQNYLY